MNIILSFLILSFLFSCSNKKQQDASSSSKETFLINGKEYKFSSLKKDKKKSLQKKNIILFAEPLKIDANDVNLDKSELTYFKDPKHPLALKNGNVYLLRKKKQPLYGLINSWKNFFRRKERDSSLSIRDRHLQKGPPNTDLQKGPLNPDLQTAAKTAAKEPQPLTPKNYYKELDVEMSQAEKMGRKDYLNSLAKRNKKIKLVKEGNKWKLEKGHGETRYDVHHAIMNKITDGEITTISEIKDILLLERRNFGLDKDFGAYELPPGGFSPSRTFDRVMLDKFQLVNQKYTRNREFYGDLRVLIPHLWSEKAGKNSSLRDGGFQNFQNFLKEAGDFKTLIKDTCGVFPHTPRTLILTKYEAENNTQGTNALTHSFGKLKKYAGDEEFDSSENLTEALQKEMYDEYLLKTPKKARNSGETEGGTVFRFENQMTTLGRHTFIVDETAIDRATGLSEPEKTYLKERMGHYKKLKKQSSDEIWALRMIIAGGSLSIVLIGIFAH